MSTQTDQSTVYSAKVRHVAKMLVNKEIDTQLASGRSVKLNLTPSAIDKRIQKHTIGAKAMVAEMEKEVRFALTIVLGSSGAAKEQIECILKERGLISNVQT